MIELSDGYYIDADEISYMLKKTIISPNTGRERFRTVRCFKDFPAAIEFAGKLMHRDMVHDTDDMTLSDAVKAIRAIEERFRNLISG